MIAPADFIRSHLPLIAVSGLSGVALHLAVPTSGLRRLTNQTPYWAYVWAGGAVLARYVQDNPGIVRGRRVLDLGAGSGLVGIVAAQAGGMVLAAEIDPVGQVAIGLNAAANEVSISVLGGNILSGPPPQVDLILVGDLFYDQDLVSPVLDFLDRALIRGIEVLIGDPGRTPLPVARLDRVAGYCVPDFGRPSLAPATVFRLKPDAGPAPVVTSQHRSPAIQ